MATTSVSKKEKKTREENLKSLQANMLIPVISTIIIIVLILGTVSSLLCYRSTVDCLRASMPSSIETAKDAVSMKLVGLKETVSEISTSRILYDPETSLEERNAFLNKKSAKYGFTKGIVLDKSGICLQNNTNYSSSEFFKVSANGNVFVSTPEPDPKSNKLFFSVSAPIYAGGNEGSAIIGVVVFTVPHGVINDIVTDLKLSENCITYVIDKNGYDIFDTDVQCVINKESIEELAKTDPSVQSVADFHAKARAGETGFVHHSYMGVKEFFAFTPIENSDGWSFCSYSPESDFTSGVKKAIYYSAAFMLIFITLASIIAVTMSKRVVAPISIFVGRLSELANGDVFSDVPHCKANSKELKSMEDSLRVSLGNVRDVLNDIDNMLTYISNGNFDISSDIQDKYIGDYSHILSNLKVLKANLNTSFRSITQIAEQVSSGVSQTSSGAQSLAQGATEQAGSIQELSASIAEISEYVNKNAENSKEAQKITEDAAKIMQTSVEGMELARQAIEEISSTSKDISKVIKTIDDIAFQTNILALNAAVEAARAGSSGKGFAVVADEVRNLSQKSAVAAKNTAALIEDSLSAVGRGVSLVNKTSSDFDVVAEKVAEVTKLITDISEQANHQAGAIDTISNGVEQISSVVQMNSATAEQSAAASEELSAQALNLVNLVENFKLSSEEQE